MKIKYDGAPEGIFRIKVPPKLELTFVDGICEVEQITGVRLLASHEEFKQVVEDKIESKGQDAPEIPKVKVGRPAKKIETEPVEDPSAISDFVKQI